MICIKCKSKLLTKRTIENHKSVKRERYCKKCDIRFYTVEILESDYDNQILKLNIEIEKQIDAQNKIKMQYDELKNNIRNIMKIVNSKSK